MQFSKLQRNSRRLGLQKKVLVTSSLLKKDRMVTNLYCSNPGRPSCPIWSQFGNASRWGLRDFSRHSCTTAVSRPSAQASPGAVERSLGRSPPQVDALQPVTQPVIEVPDDSQTAKVGSVYAFLFFIYYMVQRPRCQFFCKVHKLKHKVI